MPKLTVAHNGITRFTATADRIVFKDSPAGVWLRVQRVMKAIGKQAKAIKRGAGK